jgi:hypothetical protein
VKKVYFSDSEDCHCDFLVRVFDDDNDDGETAVPSHTGAIALDSYGDGRDGCEFSEH